MFYYGTPLPQKVVEVLENKENQRIVSVVTLWEFKISLSKLQNSKPLSDIHQHLISNSNFEILDIEFPHLNMLLTLPHYHKDPFDRLLIAQAITEKLIIISADRHFIQYPVSVIW